ncbi:MAG: hypothetical protein ACOCUI_04435, partial [bacterium]
SELDNYYISRLLDDQPQLIKYFKDRLSELSDNNAIVISLLMKHPDLIDYFKDYLYKLDDSDKMYLSNNPKLKPYFK